MKMLAFLFGNYTSQYFANIYLNELDQYLKRELHIKYYVRYMDDFVLLLSCKKECIDVKNKIVAFLKSNLKLELNDKTRYYPYKMGVNFCGYRIFCTHKLLRISSKKKIKSKIKKWNNQFNNKQLDIDYAMQSLNSWCGHAMHCNSYSLKKKIMNSCNFLYNNKTYETIYQETIDDINSYINNKLF